MLCLFLLLSLSFDLSAVAQTIDDEMGLDDENEESPSEDSLDSDFNGSPSKDSLNSDFNSKEYPDGKQGHGGRTDMDDGVNNDGVNEEAQRPEGRNNGFGDEESGRGGLDNDPSTYDDHVGQTGGGNVVAGNEGSMSLIDDEDLGPSKEPFTWLDKQLLMVIGGIRGNNVYNPISDVSLFFPNGSLCPEPMFDAEAANLTQHVVGLGPDTKISLSDPRKCAAAVTVSTGVLMCGGRTNVGPTGQAQPKESDMQKCFFWLQRSKKFITIKAEIPQAADLKNTIDGFVVMATITSPGLDAENYDKIFLFVPRKLDIPGKIEPKFFIGLWNKNARTISWVQREIPRLEQINIPFLIHGNPCGLVHDFKFKLFGGRTNSFIKLNGVLAYDEYHRRWNLESPFDPLPGPPRINCAACVYNHDIVISGGNDVYENTLYDVWHLDHRFLRWKNYSEMLKPRKNHAMGSLFDGYRENLIVAFGDEKQIQQTEVNEFSKYVEFFKHEFITPKWVEIEDKENDTQGLKYHAYTVIPQKWVLNCNSKDKEDGEELGSGAENIRLLSFFHPFISCVSFFAFRK